MRKVLTNFVASQMIPIKDENLLLPNTAVAEVINYSSPVPAENSPDWYLGLIQWRGLSIPVVSFEALINDKVATVARNSRLVVFNTLSGTGALHFYAIPTQGIPQLLRLAMKNLSLVDDDSASNDFVHCHVVVGPHVAAIPNLDSIEGRLAQHLS